MSQEKKHKVKDIFVEGPIDPAFVGTSIAKHATRMDIGAQTRFNCACRNAEHTYVTRIRDIG